MRAKPPARRLEPLTGGGITLLELLVTMAIISMIVAIAFPSFLSGLDGIRLQSAARRMAAFLNVARGEADREQLPVEIRIDPGQNQVSALSADGSWERELRLEDGVRMAGAGGPEGAPGTPVQRFVVLPGVPAPRMQVRLETERGRSLAVSVDPLTGTPVIEGK
ncbi:MAG TPA: prepilin-type N-terminal cleavage/methylation domain-containing protein [Bryobacterales bacterium]|nr:prepilin-type N-terminal cleavage/methylation domain-containing protein [Bryobacterales bacterium]